MTHWNRTAFVIAAAACAALAVGQVTLTPKHADGLYAAGETASWTVQSAGASPATQASYALLKNGRRPAVKTGTLDLTQGNATVDYTPDGPGQVTLEVTPAPTGPTTAPAGRPKGMARDGAMFGVRDIRAALPRPDDFDAWWDGKLAELNAVPMNAKVEPADAGASGVEYARVTLDNINGTHVRAQFAKPARPGKFPAALYLQYAGVYPLQRQWATDPAKSGWLVLNVQAHDMPIDDVAAIKTLADGALKNYQAIGNTDREKSYFLRMYLGDCRALQYLASRPDWDGKTLVVLGDSMGGQQSFATVGLVGKALGVSAMIAHVPAGGDVGARSAGRSMGYPFWPDQPDAIATARYFDIANFAPRIGAPALVSLGLFDTIVPPTSAAAAFNNLAGPKELLPLHSDHGGPGQMPRDARRGEWLSVLAKGLPAPVKGEN